MDNQPPSQLVSGLQGSSYQLALVLKLTYDITERGQCEPAEELLPLIVSPEPYDSLELPEVSPPSWDCDVAAFKPGTDVVIQGHAYNSSKTKSSVDVGVKTSRFDRTIRVTGDRFLDWHNGQPIFTTPEPFDKMPLRYDRAYGGYDSAIETDEAEMFVTSLASSYPDERWDVASRQYYPRNPTGTGYTGNLESGISDGMRIPNLEFPFDPMTPERMAVGDAANWINCPLPACFDWVDPSWFPRIGYLGLTPAFDLSKAGLAEIKQGWAASDLLEVISILQLNLHPTFQHGASSCLIAQRIQPGTQFLLSNLFPGQPERVIELTKKSPKVKINITEQKNVDCHSFLSSVIIRPDEKKLIEVWSARAEVARPYGADEMENMKWEFQWT